MVKNHIMDKNNGVNRKYNYIKKNLNNFFFVNKYFNIFIIIGFLSIILELIAFNFLKFLNFNQAFSNVVSLLAGITFAFYLNFFYNFKIHKSKISRAFLFFFIISFFSWSFQKLLSHYFIIDILSYEFKRLTFSGAFFIIGYLLHRKFSFSEFKKIGIAFYLDKKINLKKIFKIIGNNSNFIHIDIVDRTFSKNNLKNEISVLSNIKKIWPNHKIQTHIMSKKPSRILEKVIDYSDTIFIHWEITENLNELRKKIEAKNKKFGIAITLKTQPKKILNILKKSSNLLILSIDDPGFSGQSFNFRAFKYIEYFNKVSFRSKFRICVDGGVDKNIIKILNVDDVVSNSAILRSSNPAREIIKFQSTKYHG